MARKIIHQLVDDLDGTVLDPGAGQTVLFSLDGRAYEIDLTDDNASAFRESLARYTAAGRRVASARSAATTSRSSSSQSRSNIDYGPVRAWARAQGLTVSDRGRVPATILAAYEEAH